jgi:colanic acid biosynthesis protein WcaH
MSELLPREDFLAGVRILPLVSIDLIVRDGDGRVLVGERRNRPAQGSWFVPGGRVLKDESLDEAFRRIAGSELAFGCERQEARFRGVFEHHYPDNAGDESFSTHYVVLAYELDWPQDAELPNEQHAAWRWLGMSELLSDAAVHPNTAAYARLT